MSSSGKRILLSTVVAACAAATAACTDRTGPGNDAAATPSARAPVGDGSRPDGDGLPEMLLGQRVTITSEIEQVVSPQAFRVGPNRLLVVSTNGDFAAAGAGIDEVLVEDRAVLHVTGTVRTFDLTGFEREFGIDYDDELFASFHDQPVIVADDVRPLAQEPLIIAGEVDSVLSPVSFWLSGAAWKVVVLDADPAAIHEGDFVEVRGTVTRLDIADIEDARGIDLDETVYGEYANDLVLVAESVTASAPAGPEG